MEKLLIVTPGTLPVPAVKGGAIETFIQFLIDYNEKQQMFDITLVTQFDKECMQQQKKYKNCKFINIKYERNLLGKILNVILSKLKIGNFLHHKSYNELVDEYIIANNYFNKILFENNFKLICDFDINKYKGKKYYHIHYNDINSEMDLELQKKIKTKFSQIEKIITVSDFIKVKCDEILANITKTIPIKISIDIKNFSHIESSYLNEIKSKINADNQRIIMYAGRLVKEKGVLELIKAFKKISTSYNAKLVIVGGVTYSDNRVTEYIKELYEESKGYNIYFTGYVNYKMIKYYYANAEILCLPTLYVEEAAGTVLLEARTLGVKIVSTDSGGIPEYLGKNDIKVIRDNHFIDNLSLALINSLNIHKVEEESIEYYNCDRFSNQVFNCLE